MKDETRTRLLRVVLIVAGAGLCVCGALLFVPATWLKAAAGLWVAADTLDSIWPEEALFGYLLRAALVSYLWLGIVLLVAASAPATYRKMIDVAAGMLLLLSSVLAAARPQNESSASPRSLALAWGTREREASAAESRALHEARRSSGISCASSRGSRAAYPPHSIWGMPSRAS